MYCMEQHCGKEFGIKTWKYLCKGCGQYYCAEHFIAKEKIAHLTAPLLDLCIKHEGICHPCFKRAGFDSPLFIRSVIENKCAFCEDARTCTNSSDNGCASCGLRFCSTHLRETKELDSQQKSQLIRYPESRFICSTCSENHVLPANKFLSDQINPAIDNLDRKLTKQINEIDQKLNHKILETESALRRMADDTEKRADTYVLRLAVAGLNFMLIYILVPNIQRWQALDITKQCFTVSGITLASIWLCAWIIKNFKTVDTRLNTIILVMAGLIVITAKFFVGTMNS